MLSLFFFNDTATTEIYTLSLHDALPIYAAPSRPHAAPQQPADRLRHLPREHGRRVSRSGAHRRRYTPSVLDRKSTRLNSSHLVISYAVFCLKKKNQSGDHL